MRGYPLLEQGRFFADSPTMNKPAIEKCIVSFSHNKYDSRSLADREAVEKVRCSSHSGERCMANPF